MDWVNALRKWNVSIQAIQPIAVPVLILQGDRDRTVDWNYNIPFLRAKLPLAQVEIISGAKHQLFNERESLRLPIFEQMLEYLKENTP